MSAFGDRATAEAIKFADLNIDYHNRGAAALDGFWHGAKWAREQEPTEAEVEAAHDAIERITDISIDDGVMRAALVAAAKARAWS